MNGLPLLHENERLVIELVDSPVGDALYIPIGACHVGSCNVTAEVGKKLTKGIDEVGHFAFGESTAATRTLALTLTLSPASVFAS